MKKGFVTGRVIATCLACLVFSSLLFNVQDSEAFDVNMSPNIINIDSSRIGDIRIYTDVRYSWYINNRVRAFVYFNESQDSIEQITATRDSLGNLILKFSLDALLRQDLKVGSENDVKVVIVPGLDDSAESEGNGVVYIADKTSSYLQK